MKTGQKRHKAPLKELGAKAMNAVIIKIMVTRGKRAMRTLDSDSKNAIEISEQLLRKLLEENKDTEYGKKYGFADIHSIAEYQEKIPLTHYDDYAPYIERMIHGGEENLLSAAPTMHYALSSGSVGVPKHIPASQTELDIYAKYGTSMCFAVADEYYRNTTGKHMKSGMLFNAIEVKLMKTERGIPKGPISGALLEPVQKMIPYAITSPWSLITAEGDVDMKYLKLRFALERRDITILLAAFMTGLVDLMDYLRENWPMLCRDISQGVIDPDIRMPQELRADLEARLTPNSSRADELRREFEKGFDTPIIPRIWPDVQAAFAIGTGGFSTYSRKLRKYTGKNIPYEYLTYAASEALMGTARHCGDTSYVLVPESGFYEFIPIKEEESGKLLTIDQLKEGEEYEVVLTNVSGFYRYQIGDVIRVTGFYNEAPLIEFVYRKSQMLSIAGEKTNEEAVRWVIDEFMRQTGETVVDYSVFADVDTQPGHYVVLMETDGIVPPEKLEEYRDIVEEKLMHANPSFGDKIRTGVLGKTELKFVQQQTYQLYRDLMIMKGTSSNQLKPVRVIDTPMKERFFFGLVEDYGGEA